MTSLVSLPPDVLARIMNKLSVGEALLLGTTCRALHCVVNSDGAWLERCDPWKGEAFFRNWLQLGLSGKALFRLSDSLANLIGTWTCQDLSPRGGLLYITWGSLSVVGWKVSPEATGRVSFAPLFEVIGLHDGSTRVELVSTTTNSRLPATLNWSSASKQEFQLEIFGRDDLTETQLVRNGVGVGDVEVGNEFSLALQQNLLLRGFPLGPDNQRLPLPPLPDQLSGNIAQSVFHYLKRLASFRNARTVIPSELEGVKYSYQKLELQSGPEHKLAGLWFGVYGPHGVEILTVYYDGDYIIGKKVLGDPHIPCGEMSFKVHTCTETKEIPPSVERIAEMASESKVLTSYRGAGRLADYNFRNPKWVKGWLFIHQGGGISFMWEPLNFIICFAKLELLAHFLSEGADQVVLPLRL